MNTKQIEQFTTPVSYYFEQGHMAGYEDGYNQAMKDMKGIFTKAEVDYLVSTLSKAITILENVQLLSKMEVDLTFEQCNPEDDSTTDMFNYMNTVRGDIRKRKKDIKKLAAIQSKLKKLRSA